MAGRKTRKDDEPKDQETAADTPETSSEDIKPDTEATADAQETPVAETEAEQPETPEETVEEGAEEPEATPEDAVAEASGFEETPAIEPESPAVAPAPAVVKRGPGFVPLVLGGIVAAGLGFGAAQYLPQYFQIGPAADQMAALKSDLVAQAKTIAALQAKLAELDKTAAGMTSQVDAVSNDLGSRIDSSKKTLSAGIETNTLAIADLKKALSQRPATDGAGGAQPAASGAELTALNQKVAALESQVKAQIDAAQQAAAASKAKAEAAARQASARAALTRVDAALTAGGPFAEPIATLKGAGVEVPQALSAVAEAGVPSAASLQQSFAPAARDALAVSIRSDLGGGIWARFTAFLQVQTGARSLTPRKGDGPDAVLSRAQAAVAGGDFAAATETIKALPEAGQKAMAGWVAQADTRLQAVAAAKELAAKLNGA